MKINTRASPVKLNVKLINPFVKIKAGKYLRKCSMSLQASTTKYINNLRMSDPFFKIFEYSQDGKPVTLMLTHANGDSSESKDFEVTF